MDSVWRRYRRRGEVTAERRGQPWTWTTSTGEVMVMRAQVVATLEGDAVAHESDWIVRGAGGEQWPVPDDQFRKTYDGPID